MERVTGSLAGGSYHLLGVRMAQLQDQLGFLFMADRAFPLLDTVAGAGGFLQGLPLAPRMGAGCGNGPSLLLTAQSAGPGLLTGLGASGSLGHSPFAPLMAGGRNRPLFHLTAVEAGPGLLPRFGAGCSLSRNRCQAVSCKRQVRNSADLVAVLVEELSAVIALGIGFPALFFTGGRLFANILSCSCGCKVPLRP